MPFGDGLEEVVEAAFVGFGFGGADSDGSQWVFITRAAKSMARTVVASDLACRGLSGGKSKSACGFRAAETKGEERMSVMYRWRDVNAGCPVVLL